MEAAPTPLLRRQIWANPSPTTTSLPHTCSPFRLPSGGLVNLGDDNIITLAHDAVFQPSCPSITIPQPLNPLQSGLSLSVLDRQEPFYSSTNPQIYAISAVTIVSYMLVIILFITPQTFYIGGAGGGVSLLGRRGTIGGSYGSNTVIGIGSRPWLQKLAALTLAISLTIVTADTFMFAERQYNDGYQDADELSRKVISGLEIRISRLISESFLWLAQSQTLIRLFQRHKEKLMIKWTAFVLITLQIIFSILNHFVVEGKKKHPRAFVSSIPALNYLFALSLNICYAAFVIIYALRKRRFAFVHPQMQSMPLMALLSLTAVLIPSIFFILDLSKPDVTGWGEYVRWVGDCASSVVVWEWVERIEALEREEKKDGILGREIFDGDEMLENQPPKRTWPNSPQEKKHGEGRDGGFGGGMSTGWRRMTRFARRLGVLKKSEPIPTKNGGNHNKQSPGQTTVIAEVEPATPVHQAQRFTTPPNVGMTVDRADTASAATTIHKVHYHSNTQPTPTVPEEPCPETQAHQPSVSENAEAPVTLRPSNGRSQATSSRLSRIPFPFRRQRQSPPAEVAAALAAQCTQQRVSTTTGSSSILRRLHLRGHQHPIDIPSDVIVVPAPPRRRPSFSNNFPAKDDQDADLPPSRDSGDGVDEEDRPPAAVRHALRISNPATPVVEHGLCFPTSNDREHIELQPSRPTMDTMPKESNPALSLGVQYDFRPTNHER
ncbi:MAG: hypothetical protein Q9164_003725 [Protoblastenia rupestris]